MLHTLLASAFSSGMGAISTVFNLLNAGEHVVTTADLYAGTDIYLKKIADRLTITTTFIKDPTEPINYEVALQANTKVQISQALFQFIWKFIFTFTNRWFGLRHRPIRQ